jgi:hypothetical protein
MRSLTPRAGGRSIGLLVLAVLIAGVLGSALSYILSSVFPVGPVREFFFAAKPVAVGPFDLDLVFIRLTLGVALSVNVLAIVLVALAVYVWYKF